MRVRGEIPETFRRRPGLSRAAATRLGVSDAQWRHPDLARPFHGVVSAHSAPMDHRDARRGVCTADAGDAVLQPQHSRICSTGSRCRAPSNSRRRSTSVLAAAGGLPRAQGVQGHHECVGPRTGAPRSRCVLSRPVDTWCELWRELSLEELVAAGDYLVTGDEPYSGVPPLATLDELQNGRLTAMGAAAACEKLREALALVRYGSMSPHGDDERVSFLVGAWAAGTRAQPPRVR